MEARIQRDMRWVLLHLGRWFRRRWALALMYVPVIFLIGLGRNTDRPILYVDAIAALIVGIAVADPFRMVSGTAAPETRTFFSVLSVVTVSCWNLPLMPVAKAAATLAAIAIMALVIRRNTDWLEAHEVLNTPVVVQAIHDLEYADPSAGRDSWERTGGKEVRTAMRISFGNKWSDKKIKKYLLLAYLIGHANGCRELEKQLRRKDARAELLEAQLAEAWNNMDELREAAGQADALQSEVNRLRFSLGEAEKAHAKAKEKAAALEQNESRDHKIRRLRDEGMKQAEIAAACGCSVGTVSNVLKKTELEEAS